jgi:hypothetical protein
VAPPNQYWQKMSPLCVFYRYGSTGIIKKPIGAVIPTAMRGVHTAVISIAVSAALSVVSAFPTATSTSPSANQRSGNNGFSRFGGLPTTTTAAVTWCGAGPWRSLSSSSGGGGGSSLKMSATAADFAKQEIAANKVVVFRYVPYQYDGCYVGVTDGGRR